MNIPHPDKLTDDEWVTKIRLLWWILEKEEQGSARKMAALFGVK